MSSRQPFTVGAALATTIQVAYSNVVPFLVLTVLMHAPWIGLALAHTADAGVIAAGPWSWLSSLITAGVFALGTARHQQGKAPGIGGCLGLGLCSSGRAILVGLWVSVQIALPWLLVLLASSALRKAGMLRSGCSGMGEAFFWAMVLIPPAAICTIALLCRFYLAVPAAVLEGLDPFQACRRSAELTRGNRCRVLGLFLSLGLVIYAGWFALGFLTIPAVARNDLGICCQVAWMVLGSMCVASSMAVSYGLIGGKTDDIGSEPVAPVFRSSSLPRE